MSFLNQGEFSLPQKINNLNWLLIYLILSLIAIGCLMLYSAGGGSFQPWLIRQLIFVFIFFPLMLAIAIVDIRIWFRIAYLAYGFALLMVIFVDIAGHNALGATRWFRIGSLTIQPSEIMKVCLIFALARYYSDIEIEEVGKIKYLIAPLLMIAVPVFFVFHQPDLGTASILLLSGVSVLFAAGIRVWKFIAVGIAGLISVPFIWNLFLYDYQKQRVMTFLNPNNDPLGSGYNIIQSKIAIGSGGFIGKGYLNGTQGQLDFLPEKQTDFIFTMLSEELGFIGSTLTILIFAAVIAVGINIALNIRHQYGKLLTIGIINIFFIHMFINIGMVTGLIPVVGAPLPFISYGGTITASMLIGFGLLLNADLYKHTTPAK